LRAFIQPHAKPFRQLLHLHNGVFEFLVPATIVLENGHQRGSVISIVTEESFADVDRVEEGKKELNLL